MADMTEATNVPKRQFEYHSRSNSVSLLRCKIETTKGDFYGAYAEIPRKGDVVTCLDFRGRTTCVIESRQLLSGCEIVEGGPDHKVVAILVGTHP